MSRYTGCPTRYRTRQWGYCNDIWSGLTSLCKKCDIIITCAGSGHHLHPDRIRCNIFIGVRIIKVMLGSVASGAPYTYIGCLAISPCKQLPYSKLWLILFNLVLVCIWCAPWRWPFKGFDMIYLLTAIGSTPGGSSTIHIYTQTIHRTSQWNRIPRMEHT